MTMMHVLRTIPTIPLVVLLASAPAAGQSVQGGIKGGMSFSTLQGINEVLTPSSVSTDTRLNYVFGVFVKANVSQWFAIQPELLYVRKGGTSAFTGLFTQSVTYSLNYIDIPILARLQSGRGSGFYVIAGPTFGLNVTASVENETGQSEDVKDGINTSEVGLVIGGGVDFAHMLVEGRYTRGLSNIAKNTSDNVSVENRAFSILFGIRF